MKTVVLGLILVLFIISSCSNAQETAQNLPEESFCGTSTKASCTSDSDCISSGCSGQICQSSSEEQSISTCEYKDCYDEAVYGFSCTCIEQKCSWG